ncbi:MAG: UvrD-helicase domain-containing protein, partial [Methylotenera sp.]|nr:UvrD-helicase domain-containing protein [Methylotenera sp.]
MKSTLLELDALNRERALEHASFIVEAPAGAGKTELLTQRYLSLLAIVNEPEEIIALTFTNKAAAEMRNRILLSLENAQLQTPETAAHKLKTRQLANAALEQSHSKQWNILQQPNRLRIMTMDALCSSLTKQMPLLSRFGGQPQVSDDTDTQYLEAARRAIAQVALETSEDDTVTVALRYLDNNSEKLTALLAKMLAMRDQWLPLAGQLHSLETHDISAHTQAALEHLVTEYLESAFQILTLEVQQCLMPLARFAASNLDEKSRIMHLMDWQTALKAHPSDLHHWQALARFLLTQGKTYRKKLDYRDGFPADKEHKPKKKEFLQIVSQLGNSTAIGNLLGLPALETLVENQPVIQALTKLLFLATTHLWAVFQSAGQVDFVAIAQSAQQALENEHGATDLALKLDYQISHLLIDEFQDTSPVQMRLIEKLIEGWQPDDGRTLFCVGDPMQSIYRFRKADVSLFLQAAQYGIGYLPLARLQLTRNNRSHPAVVDWVNNAFKQIFPARDNIHQGAIEYREFTASRNKLDKEGVVLHPLILENTESEESESLDSKQIEATYVADLIEKIRQQNQEDFPNETRKIAVLVRNRSHLRELVSEIRRNHVSLKFQAVEIEHLNDRQTVQDALSLTYAMHHRAERTHWLSILRAPWCGLTLVDLHTLVAHNHYATVWQLMHDEASIKKLTEDGKQRLMHVRIILAAAFDNQGHIPVRRWLESTWLQLGGSKCLVEAGDNRDVQAFFDLVEKSSRNGRLDMTALELGMQKLYAEPDIEADDSLQ